jgi:hypothetical protein
MTGRPEPLPNPEVQPVVSLWPVAGRALGLGRSATYEAAARGEIPGLIRVGRKYGVATAALRRALWLDAPSTPAA